MNSIRLKPYEARLIAHCLEMASDEFSNHGCNDFDLDTKAFSLTDAEKRELTLNMAIENGDDEDIQYVRTSETPRYTTDWCVMSYFSRMFAGMKLPEAAPEPEGEKVIRLRAQILRQKEELERLHKRMGAAKDMVIQVAHRL